MKTATRRIFLILGILTASLVVCALAAILGIFVLFQVFVPERDFEYSPELLTDLRPYLEQWTTESCSEIDLSEISQIRAERESLQDVLAIYCGSMETPQDESVTAIFIPLRSTFKGLLFVPSGSVIQEGRGYILRQIDDRFWVYNSVD